MSAAPDAVPAASIHWNWLLLGPAVVLVVVGVWLTRGRREEFEEERRVRRLEVLGGKESAQAWYARAKEWRMRLSDPTRMVVGLSAVLLGYHVVAWTTSDRLLAVPVERWWVLALLILVGVGASLGMDRKQRGALPGG
ncbi:MAG: hypothetical protein U0637_05875 [Phycisphaerales bacterium]